jgi:hypothetical protein
MEMFEVLKKSALTTAECVIMSVFAGRFVLMQSRRGIVFEIILMLLSRAARFFLEKMYQMNTKCTKWS